MLTETAAEVAKVVQEDTELPTEQATLVAVALVGMSQVVARYWITTGSPIPRAEAARIVGLLGWRGLGGFPKTGGDEIER